MGNNYSSNNLIKNDKDLNFNSNNDEKNVNKENQNNKSSINEVYKIFIILLKNNILY